MIPPGTGQRQPHTLLRNKDEIHLLIVLLPVPKRLTPILADANPLPYSNNLILKLPTFMIHIIYACMFKYYTIA